MVAIKFLGPYKETQMSLEEIQSILNPLFRYGFEVSIAGIIERHA